MRLGLATHRGSALLACLLVAASVAQGLHASRLKSPAFDEPAHIAAGLSYALTGQVRANPQHPPLVKLLSGLTLAWVGLRLPDLPETHRMLEGAGYETPVGNAIISEGGPDRVMFWARLPPILLSGLLAALVYLLGRRLVGDLAALCALALTVFDPTIAAHSIFVTMDVTFAAFTLLFCFALFEYLQRPDNLRLTLAGLALGLVLATKFSAVCLLPVAAALVVAAMLRPPPGANGPFGLLRPFAKAPSHAERSDAVYGLPAGLLALLTMALIATLVIQVLYLSPDGAYLYAAGAQRVNADHDPSYLVFLAGQFEHNFPAYFAVAYLLKEPLATLLLVGIGLLALLRGRSIPPLAKLLLLLPPFGIFAVHSLWADDLGIRYIIPALPFTHLMGGVGAAWLVQSPSRWARALFIVLGVWVVAAAAGIYPDSLADFNEAACMPRHLDRIGLDAGSRCGTEWLDDSNVDWGQGLKQLKTWQDANARGRQLGLAYFGSSRPEAYGILAKEVDWATLLGPPSPGLHAVSAHFVARGPAASASLHSDAASWLDHTPPIAVVGHSFYIYDLTTIPGRP
jgi:hypothetical protein